MPSAPSQLQELFARREEFKGFLAKRLKDSAAAEDLLQDSLVKALRHAEELRDGEKLTAWFYRVLRNAATDFARSRSAARTREVVWAIDSANEPEAERQICRCFEGLLGTLKPRQAELLQKVEFEGESVAEVAARLGITPNHASVNLHRARVELRKRLEAFCGDCSAAACLDCECAPPEAKPQPETKRAPQEAEPL